ncbi:MAG: AAA family ATPase [Pseudomonadota bacterium]
MSEGINPNSPIWGTEEGWFSASYGPFRRFYGGDRDYEQLFYSNPKLAPHLSVFGEDVALTESLNWLQNLHIKQLEGQNEGQMLEALKTFLNQGAMLPHNTVLHKITSDTVMFVDGNGCQVPIERLSDGYRSILSMTFELIRQMVHTYGVTAVLQPIQQGRMEIDLPGVVLIDEIDAHLHPSWQRRVGLWFRRYFPQLQFIVTTHSPLICQAAEHGTVWRLPTPGSDLPGGRLSINRDAAIHCFFQDFAGAGLQPAP